MRPMFTPVQWDISAPKAQGDGMLVSLPPPARTSGGHYLWATPVGGGVSCAVASPSLRIHPVEGVGKGPALPLLNR